MNQWSRALPYLSPFTCACAIALAGVVAAVFGCSSTSNTSGTNTAEDDAGGDLVGDAAVDGPHANGDAALPTTCPPRGYVTATASCNVAPEVACYDECRECHCVGGHWICPSLSCEDAAPPPRDAGHDG
jgi:hypothetical protein